MKLLPKEGIDFILDGITWSYSSVNSYHQCPRSFYLRYIEPTTKVDNGMAQFGSFAHKILEKYYRKEAEFYELSDIYRDEYKRNVTCKFPPNPYVDLAETYYQDGLNYFNQFEETIDLDKIVGVEKKVELNIDGRKFTGVIDLIVKEDDGITIIDHKSKKKFDSKKQRADYLKQLYIYGLEVKQSYGEFPKTLAFNLVRAGKLDTEKFNEEALIDAKNWFLTTIDYVYQDEEFPPVMENMSEKERKGQEFFCDQLCSVRHLCPYSKEYIKP